MAFNFKKVKFNNPFSRKKGTDPFRNVEGPLDGGNNKDEEDIRMDGVNPFEESGKISFGDKDPRQGRKLKSKYVIGIVIVLCLIGIVSVISNMLKPSVLDKRQSPEKYNSAADTKVGPNVPSSYEELARFEDAERKKAEALAREKAEKEKKEREAKMKAERERLERERAEAERNRSVQTPRVNVNRPSVPGVAGPSNSELKAYQSPLGFSVPGNSVASGGSGIASYITGLSSNVNMGVSYSIHAGTVVPATLLSGLTSDGSSDVVAQVRQDVYDSLTGEHLLIPQGSRLLGTVTGTKNRRLAVSFQRIILPDGSSIKLPKQNAVDKSGYAGMKDKYDTHDNTFFRSAIITGVMSYLADEVDSKAGRSSFTDDNGNRYKSALNDTVGKITDRIMDRADRDADKNPSVSIRPGFQFNVFINEDLTAYEYLR